MSCGKCNTCGTRMEPCPRCKGKGIYDGYSCKHCRGIGCICPKHGAYTGSSGGGCFITTATILATGKNDDCIELNTFRRFRDNWLIQQPNGKTDIEEYYNIAPGIVDAINKKKNSKDIYIALWHNDLQKCYQLITEQKFEEARILYTVLMSRLKHQYTN